VQANREGGYIDFEEISLAMAYVVRHRVRFPEFQKPSGKLFRHSKHFKLSGPRKVSRKGRLLYRLHCCWPSSAQSTWLRVTIFSCLTTLGALQLSHARERMPEVHICTAAHCYSSELAYFCCLQSQVTVQTGQHGHSEPIFRQVLRSSNRLFSFDTTRTAQKTKRPTILLFS
jgi:hypothetical protein